MSTVTDIRAMAARAPALATATSLPGLLLARAAATPGGVAMRHNVWGCWEEITWETYARRAADVGNGLLELGVGRADRVAVHSENRPEWLLADLAVQGMGAATVGIYPTSPPSEVEYLLGHSEAVVLVAEDEEQLDKVLKVRDRLPHLRTIVVIDPRMVRRHLSDPMIMTFAQLEQLGRQRRRDEWEASAVSINPADVAIIVYTSGTTGPPKGAMLSHANLLAAAALTRSTVDVRSTDEMLSYLPLCHILERLNSAVNALSVGYVVNFGEGGPSFAADLRDVQPTIFVGVPRVWEKMLATVDIHMADATWLKRRLYWFWLHRGEAIAAGRLRGRFPPGSRVTYLLGWLVIYRSLRDKLGLRRCRIAISGAAPIAPKVLEFFWALGVPVYEGYGQTENTAIATLTPVGDVRMGKVGRAYPGTDVTLAPDGEILTRSPTTFLGYYGDPGATAEVLDAEGWLHTGDVGELDEDGFLRITDRKKDLIITAGGKNVSPSEIENMLKVSPYVREAVVVGDRRPHLAALIGVELDTVGDWASRRQLPYTTYEDLSSKAEVEALIGEWVGHVNRDLARVEQIKAFRLLPRELGHEDGQLTATQKVKRKAIAEQFGDLIEEMYR